MNISELGGRARHALFGTNIEGTIAAVLPDGDRRHNFVIQSTTGESLKVGKPISDLPTDPSLMIQLEVGAKVRGTFYDAEPWQDGQIR